MNKLIYLKYLYRFTELIHLLFGHIKYQLYICIINLTVATLSRFDDGKL